MAGDRGSGVWVGGDGGGCVGEGREGGDWGECVGVRVFSDVVFGQ